MKNHRDAYSLLTSLGVSFDRDLDTSLSPEECFIALVEEHNIVENRRLLSLAILAFKSIQDYLRPDLLKRLAVKISPKGKCVLGGIIFRNHLTTPGRWSGLKKILKKSRGNNIKIGSQQLREVRGVDPYFEPFGIKMTPVVNSHEKKLVNKNWFFARNPWIKNRVFLGPSTRADVYTVKSNFFESTAYRFMERFNYTPSSLYGIWNEIEFAQSLGAY